MSRRQSSDQEDSSNDSSTSSDHPSSTQYLAPGSPVKRRRTNVSPIWQHMTKSVNGDTVTVVCIVHGCKKHYKNTTSNLINKTLN